MSEILAYCYGCRRDDLRPLGARKVYIDDASTRRVERANLLRDIRKGDVVRVLHLTHLGGPRWRQWAEKIEARGATIEERKPGRRPRGRPRKWNMTADQEAAVRRAWLDDTAGLDARLAAVGAVLGETLTRADRYRLYQRYGSPGRPKEEPET